jgi:DNA modification methylase
VTEVDEEAITHPWPKHIDYALVAQTHPSMYLIHKFWARKPHNVVAEYIAHYSKKGELVLDPFCGSGVSIIESLRLGRRSIGIDLDPIATFITRMTVVPVDLNEFQNEFERIKQNVKDKINFYYRTTCSTCNRDALVLCTIWDGSMPTHLWYKCEHCKKTKKREVTEDDKSFLSEIDESEVPYWYPTDDLIFVGQETRRLLKAGLSNFHQLFTKRALIALSILYHAIEQIKNTETKDLMKLVFSSFLAQVSKMVPQREGATLSGNVGWTVHSYWVPPASREFNVWLSFENRFRKVKKGKMEASKEIPKVQEATTTEEFFKHDKNLLVRTRSAIGLSEEIPSDTVDFVFTDPPYGGSIQYLELTAMWSSWLKGEVADERFSWRFDEEITINKHQDKDFDYYHKMLHAAFREVYRILKPNRWLVITFHNTDIRIYNSIIKAIVTAGFDLEKIVYQPPAQTSVKALSQPYGSAVGDYYIRFRKPRQEERLSTESEVDRETYERIIVDSVKKIIARRGEPTPYTIIINSYSTIYDELKKNGYLFSAPEGIEEILKKHLDGDFVISNKKWWLGDPSKIPYLERVPLNERVERIVIDVLNRKIKASFDDILQQIFIKFPNALTPDTQSINQVLKEYAEKTKDGKWILKPSVKKRENQHNEIVKIIADLGAKAGFEVYADIPIYRKELPLSLPSENLARVKEIDVIWYSKGEVVYEFEVENTTGITEAIVRGSNITYPVKRYIVIPEERENLLVRKVQDPALKERIEKDEWNFIRYDDLMSLYTRYKAQKAMNSQEIESIVRAPRLKITKTTTIDEFT